MRILVTGANGFLASNIIRELISRGNTVKGMLRKNADERSTKGLEFERFYGNITDPHNLEKACKGCDVVIHAAANTSQAPSSLKNYIPVNIEATGYVIDAVIKSGCRRLIFVSTANTFGYGTKEDPGTEGKPMSDLFKQSGYAFSKFMAQELVQKAIKEKKLDAVIVNPTFMLGPNDSKPSSGKIIQMYYGKKTAVIPPGGKNFADVRDVAAGVCNAINKGRTGECYLLAGENLSYLEFIGRLSEAEGKKKKIILLPPKLLRAAGFFGSMAELSGIPTGLNQINSKLLCIGNYYDPAKAIKELNLPQTPFEKTLSDTIHWFGKNGMIR